MHGHEWPFYFFIHLECTFLCELGLIPVFLDTDYAFIYKVFFIGDVRQQHSGGTTVY